jgi:hypothetical protein
MSGRGNSAAAPNICGTFSGDWRTYPLISSDRTEETGPAGAWSVYRLRPAVIIILGLLLEPGLAWLRS